MKNVIENNDDWFLVSLVEYCSPDGATQDDDNARSEVWENLYLINAVSIQDAYDKAVELGTSECQGMNSRRENAASDGEWRLVGVSELIPVYEDIEDGSELLWTNHESIPLSKAREMVKPKEEWVAIRSEPSVAEARRRKRSRNKV